MRTALRTLWPLIFGLALAFAVSIKWSTAPALFSFLDPFNGVWNRGLMGLKPFDVSPIRSQFTSPIRVQIDREIVPHIFAKNELDAYVAQGYYLASQRLWQMEFLSRLAEGRLSEVFGNRTLEYDRHFRQMRLNEAAQDTVKIIEKDSFTRERMEAYTKGVNLFIKRLKTRDLPFEFKLFDTRPQEWSIYRSALILKLMTYNLSGFSADIKRTRSLQKLRSVPAFKKLYPNNIFGPYFFETLFKDATKNEAVSSNETALLEPYSDVIEASRVEEPELFPSPLNGSNSIGIQPPHSANGSTWLANDVHLDLVLPSLWYEIQIATPEFNAMGASLPGAPGIILGLNQHLAWGSTNASVDTFDWFQVFELDGNTFKVDQQKYSMESEKIRIKVRNSPDDSMEIYKSKLGPFYATQTKQVSNVKNVKKPARLLMKWTGHHPSNEFSSFLRLMRARNITDCRSALLEFVAPAQNIACADKDEAEIVLAGQLPKRSTVGDVILPLHHHQVLWSQDLLRIEPRRTKEAQQFFVNANQSLSEPEAQAFGKEFAQEFRAQALRQELAENLQSMESLKHAQNSTRSEVARRFIPFLVATLPAMKDPIKKDFIEALEEWNGNFEAYSPIAPFFTEWLQDIESRIWSPRLGPSDLFEWPRLSVLLELVSQPEAEKWLFLKMKNDELAKTIEASFHQTFETLKKYFNKDSWRDWRLSEYQLTEFKHISHIPGLSRSVSAGGSYYSPFANYGSHGPTWKMIASLKTPVKAWRILPGGNSGDPLSRRYGENLVEWSRGEIHPMSYYRKPRFNREELLIDFNNGYIE